MAYITSEQVKEKRNLLKAAFPSKEGWKLSVTREHYSGIRVEILEAPLDFTPVLDDRKYVQVNTYHIDSHYGEEHPQLAEVLNKILAIIDKGNYNNSDLMTDYHEVGFYSWINIGAWDKPFQYNPKEVKASAPIAAPAAETNPEAAPAETGNIQFVDYSDRAFAVIGEGTKKVKDLLKALCYITGENYDDKISLDDFIRYRYKVVKENGDNCLDKYYTGVKVCIKEHDFDAAIRKAEQIPGSRVEDSKPQWGQWINWTFFRIRFYKKGTAHMEFLNEDVWALFNQHIARIKGFPLYEGGVKKEKPKKARETKPGTPHAQTTVLFTLNV